MATTAEFITVARSWIGVPYQAIGWHRTGTNCIGLLIGIAYELGLEEAAEETAPFANFALPPETGSMRRNMQKYLDVIPTSDATAGDILLLKIGTEPQHMAILTEPGMVLHADIHLGKVIEHKMPDTWRPLMAFRIAELEP